MARYTGPKTKIARKFGEPIFGDDKSFEKRNYPPGQHGNNKRRSKKSEYAIQLMEKQKAKYTYGILERQFRNLFKKATASKGITGEVLLQLCESRLDNVVYRMGLSNSRRGARQLVSHRHITVNGEIVNIPSYNLKAGDVIAVREKSISVDELDYADITFIKDFSSYTNCGFKLDVKQTNDLGYILAGCKNDSAMLIKIEAFGDKICE